TNIGLGLLSTLAACDLGYLRPSMLAERIERMLNTLEGIERHKGHFLNWYDTRSLAPLYPRYVSTVDSGNLAACLMILAQGLRETAAGPQAATTVEAGLIDSVAFFRDIRAELIVLQAATRDLTAPLAREVDTLDALLSASLPDGEKSHLIAESRGRLGKE